MPGAVARLPEGLRRWLRVIHQAREEDAVLSALMNVEGVTLAKAFRDADSVNKRKLISTIARVIAETKE